MNYITITIIDVEQYDEGFPPYKLLEFQEWIADKIAEIPSEYRDSATIKIDSVASWEDSHYSNVNIEYRRPMTEVEEKKREDDRNARKKKEEFLERRQLEILKKKYEET